MTDERRDSPTVAEMAELRAVKGCYANGTALFSTHWFAVGQPDCDDCLRLLLAARDAQFATALVRTIEREAAAGRDPTDAVSEFVQAAINGGPDA